MRTVPRSIPRTPAAIRAEVCERWGDEKAHEIRQVECATPGCGYWYPVQMNCEAPRTCPRCRRKWHGRARPLVEEVVSTFEHPVFLTLTIKNVPDDVFSREHVRVFRAWFSKLRASFKQIRGGVYVLQDVNEGRGHHLHVHAICDAVWLNQKALVKRWREITGGSFIVWIEKVNNVRDGVKYLLSDFLQAPRIRPEDKGVYEEVFRGSRMIQFFGKYRSIKLRAKHECPKCGGHKWRVNRFSLCLDDVVDFELARARSDDG